MTKILKVRIEKSPETGKFARKCKFGKWEGKTHVVQVIVKRKSNKEREGE